MHTLAVLRIFLAPTLALKYVNIVGGSRAMVSNLLKCPFGVKVNTLIHNSVGPR